MTSLSTALDSSNHKFSIYHPPRPSSDGPIIIYLPRGPLASPEPYPLSSLSLSSGCTVVRLNYRLSAQYPFPTPIHDVLAGYDWITKHLRRGPDGLSEGSDSSGLGKLGVCGELIGGSLAGMLALTECHATKQGITAAGIGNPIADWTLITFEGQNTHPVHASSAHDGDTIMKRLNASPTSSTLDGIPTSETLLSLRDSIFPKAEKYFDPFASPSLFFRAPTFDLPPHSPTLPYEASTPTSQESEDDISSTLVRNRRSHRKYPPPSSGLRLPNMRIEVSNGDGNVLKKQGLEFVELMRRSVDLWESEEWQGLRPKDGNNRIALVRRTNSGLWQSKEILEIGTWFAEAFR